LLNEAELLKLFDVLRLYEPESVPEVDAETELEVDELIDIESELPLSRT